MSALFFFHKSIRIYMEVIILGANTLYSIFCFFKTLLSKQVHFGMVGKGLTKHACDSACTVTITKCHKRTSLWSDIHNSYMKRCAEHGLEVYLNSCFVGRNTAVVEALSYTDLSLILNVQQSLPIMLLQSFTPLQATRDSIVTSLPAIVARNLMIIAS